LASPLSNRDANEGKPVDSHPNRLNSKVEAEKEKTVSAPELH